MNSIGAFSTSAHSSAAPSVTDLDGYTLRDNLFNSYGPPEDDEFGFDPPEQKPTYPKLEHTYSPPEPNDLSLGGWPGFEREEDLKQPQHAYEIDKLISQNLPNASNAISRYGQVTPPRTNSTDSGLGTDPSSASASPKSTAAPERRKRTSKVQVKDPAPATATTSSGRKRKTTRKAALNVEQAPSPDDAKRKASLEKNRLAAAKCRVNKKEKTEQLQRDSHDKAVHNAFLKDQVMHMKEEIQQMNAILLAHANCKGCKAPDEIQKHLSHLSNDFLTNQMPSQMNQQPAYGEYPQMSMDDMPSISQPPMMPDSYFEHDSGMLHPPLPDFDRSADFEVHTPMQTD